MQVFATGKAMSIGMARPKLTLSFSLKNIVTSRVGRIMKLTTILLFATCLHVSANGISQTITLAEKDAPLQKVIKSIEQQTDYVFFYKSNWFRDARKVTVTANNMPLRQVLDLVFKDQPFTYFISGRNITIGPKPEVKISEKTSNDVSGKVADKDGNPLSGANVKVKGTNTGTTTNADGSFILNNVDKDAILEISYVGFETVTVSLKGRSSITIGLSPKNSTLDETVVIAYGTTTKRFTTGNIATVKSSDIEKQPVNNPLLALQGRVPGVTITQTSGLPGAGIIVRIQGQNSLLNSNNPLYVVDGVPVVTEVPSAGQVNAPYQNSGETYIRQVSTGKGNMLTYLNPSDVESIEILKDADATSIYGSRAANGAILITTKKGKSGKISLNVDLQQGFGQVGHFLKLLTTPQYLEMRNEALANNGLKPSSNRSASGQFIYTPDLSIWDTTRETNWQKEFIGGIAQYTHANTSISGGTPGLQYLLGASYHKETTVYPGDFANKRGSMHFNFNNIELKQKFHFQLSGIYSVDNNNLPRADITEKSLTLVPNAPRLYNDDGTLNWELDASSTSTFVNPMGKLLYQTYSSKTNNFIANGNFSYDILPDLKINTNLGFTDLQSNDINKNSILAERPETRLLASTVRRVFYGDSKLNSWIIEPQLSFKRKIGRGRLESLFGSSFQKIFREASYLVGAGYNNDQVMETPSAAATLTMSQFMRSLYKYNAFFGRVNYIFIDRYILNLTGRRDGSTRFGNNDKFNNFWSIAGAWIFSQESLINKNLSFLSFGKIKGSYGTTGSDQIGDYRFLTLYNIVNPVVPYQGTTGLAPGDIPNPYLQWEETKKFNLGLDLGFFKDRIFLSVSYGKNRSTNQLLDYTLPLITGRSSVLRNFPATIENNTWEFLFNANVIKSKRFNWSTSANFTIPRNKLAKFPDLINSAYKNTYIIGQPVSLSRLLHYAGVDPVSGIYSFTDIDGNTTTNPTATDLTVLYSDFQKYFGGFQNTFQFNNLQLDILFQFVKKSALSPNFGLGYAPGRFFESASSGNQTESILNRWQKPSDNADMQKYTAIDGVINTSYTYAAASDRYYLDASYLRLKNISLSWQMPSSWVKNIHLQAVRFFAQGQNILTITNYKGLDPETPGLQTLPPLRVITFGFQLKL